jgi:hypothetical protein
VEGCYPVRALFPGRLGIVGPVRPVRVGDAGDQLGSVAGILHAHDADLMCWPLGQGLEAVGGPLSCQLLPSSFQGTRPRPEAGSQ